MKHKRIKPACPPIQAPDPTEKAQQLAAGHRDASFPAASGSILTIAASGANLRVGCGSCGNFLVFDSRALWWAFDQRGWCVDVERAAARMRCTTCGKKAATISVSNDLEITSGHLPGPPRWAWQRAESEDWSRRIKEIEDRRPKAERPMRGPQRLPVAGSTENRPRHDHKAEPTANNSLDAVGVDPSRTLRPGDAARVTANATSMQRDVGSDPSSAERQRRVKLAKALLRKNR